MITSRLFDKMAQRGLIVTNRVIIEEIGGIIDEENDLWIIPIKVEFE